MKKNILRVITVSSFIIFILILVIFSLYLFPRIFADDGTKLLYKMRNTLNSYVTPKNYYLSDIDKHYFSSGIYEIKDNKECYYLYIKTEDTFYDVISDIDTLCTEMKECINSYRTSGNENTEIVLWIENCSNWSIPVYPLSDKICIGLNHSIPITDALDYCKGFEEISLGGYRGYKILIPQNFNSNYFDDFHSLKRLEISGFSSDKDKNRISEELLNLDGIDVVIDYEKINKALITSN